MMRCTVYMLACVSFAFGATAGVTLALAVSTDAWLFMSEPVSVKSEDLNVTEHHKVTVQIRSGLWRVCTININNGTYPDQCLAIKYDLEGSERKEGAPTSMSIAGAIRISAPLPVGALILELVAIILNVTGVVRGDVKTLIAGVFYILSGLALAVGIILFISAVNDEVGHRSNKKKDELSFHYAYGWSFFIAGVSFVMSELAAVVCITIFLKRNSKWEDMIAIIPGLEVKLDSYKREDSAVEISNRAVFM